MPKTKLILLAATSESEYRLRVTGKSLINELLSKVVTSWQIWASHHLPWVASSCRLVDPAYNLYILLLSRMGPCSSTSWRTPRGRENTPTPADSPSTAKQFLSYFKNGLFPTSFALFSSTISQCRDSNCGSLVSEVIYQLSHIHWGSTEVAYLLLTWQPRVRIPAFSKKNSEEKLSMLLMLING